MKIQNIANTNGYINFKGYEARKLDTILVQKRADFGSDYLMNQLGMIATRHRVDIQKANYIDTPWLQDDLYFTPNKKIISSDYTAASAYGEIYGMEGDCLASLDNPLAYRHLEGGNIFFVTNKDGEQVILTAKNRYGVCELEGYEDTFGVKKVIPLPHADFHADLFITPIGDNKVLVANDKLMIEALDKLKIACIKFVEQNPDDEEAGEIKKVIKNLEEETIAFKKCVDEYLYKGCDEETLDVLKKNGFKAIPVPSRIYDFSKWNRGNNIENPTHLLNYSNAITFKDRSNETVFITGKSGMEKKIGLTDSIARKIGTSFEKLFIEAVVPHLNPKNIHFIEGSSFNPISKILEERQGGLHCMCTEVPSYSENLF